MHKKCQLLQFHFLMDLKLYLKKQNTILILVRWEHLFKNEGTAPLTLTNVKASCGCTTPSWTKEPIAPGETGKVAAEYNMARAGGFNKSITVTTAGGETVVLYIKGEALSTENQNSVDETKPSIISEPK